MTTTTPASIAVRFTQTFSVKNGDGIPDGPHYTAGDVVILPESAADLWIRAGRAVAANEKETGTAKVAPTGTTNLGDNLDSMKAKDLVALASKEKIELGTAANRTEIIAAIRAARVEAAKPEAAAVVDPANPAANPDPAKPAPGAPAAPVVPPAGTLPKT